MRVELDIFSGRPNPAWQLSAAETTELASRLSGLLAAGEAATLGALAYRGLIISSPAESAELPAHIRVHKGIVSVWRSGKIRHYHDTNHIESWLLDHARSHGYAAIVEQILAD